MRVPVASVLALALAAVPAASTTPPTGPQTVTVASGALPARVTPLMIGVGVHFGIGGEYGYDPAKSAQAMAKIGVTSFRDDLPWSTFKAAGLSAPGKVPPRLAAMIRATPARPLLILGNSHPQMDGGETPTSPRAVNAFAGFAREAAGDTRPAGAMYEIWNEWNLTAAKGRSPLKGAGDAADPRAGRNYAALAVPTVRSVRAIDPKAKILVGAAGIDPGWQWVRSIIAGGALRGADGVSVHIYNHCERPQNRTGDQAIGQVEALHQALGARRGGASTPIYVTEVGWPTATGGGCVISRDAAADNVAQFLLWSAATPWVKGVWVYQLKDQGHRAGEIEDNFGLFDYDYRAKPGACAVRDVTAIARSATGWRLDRPRPDVYVIQITGRAGRRIIAWSESGGASLVLGAGRQAAFRQVCQTSTRAGNAIPLGTRPVIIDSSKLAGSAVTIRS